MPPKRKFPKSKWKRGLCQQRGCDLRVQGRAPLCETLGRAEGPYDLEGRIALKLPIWQVSTALWRRYASKKILEGALR
jgi:hypothetical protein